MLRLRICPNCQEEIRSSKLYFCHRCGSELPEPPTNSAVQLSDETVFSAPSTEPPSDSHQRSVKSGRIKKIFLAVALVAAVVLVVAIIVVGAVAPSYLPFGPQVATPTSPQPVWQEIPLADLSLAIENHPFSRKGLAELVPADIDLYVEGWNLEGFLRSVVPTKDWEDGQDFVNRQIGLSLPEALSFVEDEFALVQEGSASAVLVRGRDLDFLSQKIEQLSSSYRALTARLVGDFLVVSDSVDLIDSIEAAFNKLTLNLSLTSSFVEARKSLPSSGQLFVYGTKKAWFLPDNVVTRGEAFVVARRNNKTVVLGL